MFKRYYREAGKRNRSGTNFPRTGAKRPDDMRPAGFENVSFEYLTGGIVALHLGER
jgi:ubiquinone/menaquinone biosynthesis C-methylase UbiE